MDIVAWRNTAEFVSKYFTKGRMAVVSGRLQIRNWQDKDGNKRRTAEVVADNVYFGDSKRDNAEGSSSIRRRAMRRASIRFRSSSRRIRHRRTFLLLASDFSMLSDDDPELPF